jgi:hypothetical protein
MSLRLLRRSSRAIAVFLLLTSCVQLPHPSLSDRFCVPGPEAHDESKHVFTTVDEAGHADHCAICHWTRLLKPEFSDGPVTPTRSDAGGALIGSASFTWRDPALAHLPPRAPPARQL